MACAPISKDEIEQLIEDTGMRGFTPLAQTYASAFLGDETTKDLKEAILNDLAAWNILGSFIASIAFGGLLLGKVENPKTMIGFEWIYFGQIDQSSQELGFSQWWAELFFSATMTFSGFCSLRSVIAATLKYLYFNAIPHTAIIPGIKLFRLSVYDQKSNSSKIINCGAMLWDHTNSVMISIKSLSCGFVCASVMIYGTQIGCIIAIISYMLWGILESLHKQWEDSQINLVKLQPSAIRTTLNKESMHSTKVDHYESNYESDSLKKVR